MIINSFNKDYSSCRRDLQLSEDSVGKLETGIKLPVFLSASASSEIFRDLMSDVSEDTTAYLYIVVQLHNAWGRKHVRCVRLGSIICCRIFIFFPNSVFKNLYIPIIQHS